MAVWSAIQFSSASERNRFDAEYYQPQNLSLLAALRKLKPQPLAQFAFVTDGIHASPEVVENGGVRYLSAKCVKDNDFSLADTLFISNHQNETNRRTQLRPNDILITTVGTIGNAAVVQSDFLPANVDRHLGIVRLKEMDLDPYFVTTFLNTHYGRFQTLREATGNVQLNLFIEKIKTLLIPVLACQKDIAALTRRAYDRRRRAETLYSTAESALNSAVGLDRVDLAPRLFYEDRFSQVTAAGRLDAEYFNPASSKIAEHLREFGAFELRKVANVGTGFPWSSTFFIQSHGEKGEPFVRIRDCRPAIIETDDIGKLDSAYANVQRQKKAQPGDLALGMDGLKWFFAGLITNPCYINQRVAHIRPIVGSSVNPEFLLICINSLIGQKQLLRAMTIAHTVGHITLNDVRGLLIPKLPESVRTHITRAVNESCTAKKESRRLLDTAKRAVEIAIKEGETAARKFLGKQ